MGNICKPRSTALKGALLRPGQRSRAAQENEAFTSVQVKLIQISKRHLDLSESLTSSFAFQR